MTSCKKHSETVITNYVEKTILLNNVTPSKQDSLIITRDRVTLNIAVNANVSKLGLKMKRLYIYGRILDDTSKPGLYTSIPVAGSIKDGSGNYYFPIEAGYQDSCYNTITINLRTNTFARMDEYYWVYTTDTDYTGPTSSTNVVLGPAQFYIVYGKLREYTGYKLYNTALQIEKTTAAQLVNIHSQYDMYDFAYKALTDPVSDVDIAENTDNRPLFLGKFRSLNGTTYVKADSTFSYGNATDYDVAYHYSLGKPFTETPDSIRIGDVYLVKLRGIDYLYAAIKITYIVPENGKVGVGNDNEYFLFNMKR